jgi:hypothetical protein
MSLPKEKRAGESALQTAELRLTYRLLNILQAPFGFLFWMIEQRKARLQDRIYNERSDR